MTLELHVWGPAFELASLDPECLATIAYFTQALDRSEWKLVQSSPSAVPTHHLPALHTPTTTPPTWTSGLPAITSHLRATTPPTFRDPDGPLSRAARADAVAYAAHLRSQATPLLALSLYLSPANWASVSRPALSAVLPAPLGWTEAPALRTSWVAAAERSGLDSLDADSDAVVGEDKEAETRSSVEPGPTTAGRDADGWVRVPKGFGGANTGPVAKELALTAKQKARDRLDAAVAEVLDVLEDLKAEKRWFLGESPDNSGLTTLDCLAFGYLALMLVPELPRPWLRDSMRRKHEGLCSFVDDMRSTCFTGMVTSLPWSPAQPPQDSLLNVASRFGSGAVRSIPGVGEEWHRWWNGRKADGEGTAADMLVASGGILAAAALAAGFVFRKDIPMLGAPIQRWERQHTGLRSFGAVGAMFGYMSDVGVSEAFQVREGRS